MATATIRPDIKRQSHANSDGKVLPKDNEQNVLVTSALPYVNNSPHLGNIIGSVLSADVFARYNRTRNRPTLYVCGTDEYGTASETKALEDGVTPRELCDRYHSIHKGVYEWFQISFDHFGRTSTPKQTEVTQDIFKNLYKNGYFEEYQVTQPYCTKDERFLPDRYVEGTCPICGYDDARGDQCDKCTNQLDADELINPRCKTCGSRPEHRQSKQLKLLLDKLQERIEPYIRNAMETGQFSANAQASTKGWLEKGLKPRDMTRDLKWGVPVPLEGWENKVFYVWFDAPIGYPSITAEYTDQWDKWWKNPENVKLNQFMGKDNVVFHSLLFPGYLIGTGQDWTLVSSLSTTEYLQYEDSKFSKSRNIGVFGDNAKDSGIPSDVYRYYLLVNRPETQDSFFYWDDFIQRNNSELLNNLGNFVNRILKFINAKYDSVLPPIQGKSKFGDFEDIQTSEQDQEFFKEINELLSTFIDQMESIKIRNGLTTIMQVTAKGNNYLQSNSLGNDLLANDPQRCATVCLVAVNLIYVLSVMLYPYLPTTADSILNQLNAPSRSLPESFQIDILPGHKINPAQHLFKRIDPKMVEVWRNQYGGSKPKEEQEPKMSKSQLKKLQKEERKKKEAEAAAAKAAVDGVAAINIKDAQQEQSIN